VSVSKKKKSKKAPLRGNRYGYGKGLSASDQRRQKKAFKKNVKKYKKGDKSAFEPTAVDKEVMADRKAGRRPPAPESRYNDSMETPKLKVSILNEDWKKAIAKKAKASGKSASVLRKVYKRGLAAYASGHRPGMSQHAWAMARVNSYLRGGPARKVDSDIKEGVEHGTDFHMVHVRDDPDGRKHYKIHAHCAVDGHAGHVEFSTHDGNTDIHNMEIKHNLLRQGYGPALINHINDWHQSNADQDGELRYVGGSKVHAGLHISDIPAAGGDLMRLQRGQRPLTGMRAKVTDLGKSISRVPGMVMRVIRNEALSPEGLRDRLTRSVGMSRRAGSAIEQAIHDKHPGTAADYYLGKSGGAGVGGHDDAGHDIDTQVSTRRDRLNFVQNNQHRRGSAVQRVMGTPGRLTRLQRRGTDDSPSRVSYDHSSPERNPSYDLGHRTRFGTGGGARARGGLLHNVINLLTGKGDPSMGEAFNRQDRENLVMAGRRQNVADAHQDLDLARKVRDRVRNAPFPVPPKVKINSMMGQWNAEDKLKVAVTKLGTSKTKKGARRGSGEARAELQQAHLSREIATKLPESVEKSGERFSGYNKPKRTPGARKKFAVLAKEGSKVRIIRFGDPNMRIKKNIPGRRKNFRARHGCDKGKLSKMTARYWSCRKW